ncbi:hypothetical protein HWV62_22094 [Athelia sp. TMB]|nr:hypothetical protein HWV62_22094 [Athelia sp. TMB]
MNSVSNFDQWQTDGDCTEEDIAELEKLVITENGDNTPDFDSDPWSDAVLVTPRNAVREAWNKAAMRKHCSRTGNILYEVPAEDTAGNPVRECDMWEREAISKTKQEKSGRLPHRLEVAIGMKAMITFNTATEADLANGSRGTIESIVLDPREPPTYDGERMGHVRLKYPPAMMLFRPYQGSVAKFPGIPEGLVPIFPSQASFKVKHHGTRTTSVKRRQFALVVAYAFTDHKAQGQTLDYAIIDIGPTKRFPVNPFAAYVALSRGRGRDSIRLLRKFDASIFTRHPSEHLRLEDKRLLDLANMTKTKFQSGFYDFK